MHVGLLICILLIVIYMFELDLRTMTAPAMPPFPKMLPLTISISSILFFLIQAAQVFSSISILPNKP